MAAGAEGFGFTKSDDPDFRVYPGAFPPSEAAKGATLRILALGGGVWAPEP